MSCAKKPSYRYRRDDGRNRTFRGEKEIEKWTEKERCMEIEIDR